MGLRWTATWGGDEVHDVKYGDQVVEVVCEVCRKSKER